MGSISDAQSFLEINRWRRGVGIPDEVFVIEKVGSTMGTVYKPQVIDFRSPSFIELFRSIVNVSEHEITLEEALPVRAGFPQDAAGVRWGVELILDSLALCSNELPPAVAGLDLEDIVLQKGRQDE
jgi:hypothetical protein